MNKLILILKHSILYSKIVIKKLEIFLEETIEILLTYATKIRTLDSVKELIFKKHKTSVVLCKKTETVFETTYIGELKSNF